MGIKAVLFDGYGTLFEDAFATLADICGHIVRSESLGIGAKAFLDLWDRHFFPLMREDGFRTLRDLHLVSLGCAFKEVGTDAEVAPYVNLIFERFGSSRIYDDVRPTLAALDGHLIAIVSNADVDHLDQAIELNRLAFPLVVSSESARCYKPDPRIFHEALAELGVEPEASLYVGDSQDDDIVGAKRAGMRVAWINRTGQTLKTGVPRPDYEIHGLGELMEIVQALTP